MVNPTAERDEWINKATQALFTRARVERVVHFATSPLGHGYAVLVVADSQGATHTCLSDNREVNPDYVPLLSGCDVRVVPTEKGLRLARWETQFTEVHETVIERLENPLPDPQRVRVPSVEVPDPESAKRGEGDGLPSTDEILSVTPHLREIVGWVGETAQREGLAACGYIFIPLGS